MLLACGQGAAPVPTSAPTTGASQDACRYLTAQDVQQALGGRATVVPLGSPPPAGPFLGACDYVSSTGARVSLSLFRGMPIDSFASAPRYQAAPGIGDRAFVSPSTIVVQKGTTTFQIVLSLEKDPGAADSQLRRMAGAVTARLP